MNERIKALSDIAYKNHLKNNPHSSFGRRSDYDKEFAELIIRECSTLAYDGPRGILEHFGIEDERTI